MDATALLIRKALFPAWVRKNRSSRLLYLQEFERTQFLSPDALADLQWTQFKTLLRHAFDHCAFYRNKLSAQGMVPDDVKTPDDIARIPTTSKQEIQESLVDLMADNVPRRPLIKDMTGGSTGSPMVFYYDADRLDSREAATIRHNRWTGWDLGEKMAVLWGASRDMAVRPPLTDRTRDWILGRKVLLDASVIDETRLHAFCEALVRHRPAFVLAYANTMALFARYVQSTGLNPMQPRGIICSAEVLTKENRELIESTFKCPVYNRYGSREFAVIASECANHSGMHVNAENLLLEVLTDGVPSIRQDGDIVITDLKNHAMPLIRYRTMDVGQLVPEPCGCGRGLPRLELSGGRVTDFLTAIAGHKVSGIVLATYVITNIPGIRQIQFLQEHLHRVTVRVVRGPDWSDNTNHILNAKIRGFLGPAMGILVEFTDVIPSTDSGKYRFSVSMLAT